MFVFEKKKLLFNFGKKKKQSFLISPETKTMRTMEHECDA